MIDPTPWLAADPDPDTRAELEQLLATGDQAGLADRFGARLQFGTAGLRGALGAGPNRMNRVLVRQAAFGLAEYVRALSGPGASVVIGYDARHKSDVFAADTAAVFVAAGLRAQLFATPVPTPVLAFAITHLGAAAGVQVTASHNPPADNGYKVYLGDGAQIIPPTDEQIAANIASAPLTPPMAVAGIETVSPAVIEAYLDGVNSLDPRSSNADERGRLCIVHTSMHGVGWATVRQAFTHAGFSVHAVPSQAEPDPDFPTVAFPNPEEPGALDLAYEEARTRNADIILANDPDADRLAVAVPDQSADGGWRRLSGDEVGWLLADHLLRATTKDGPDRLVVTTVVSSAMLRSIAEDHGVTYVETLTGFKWLARAALARPALRPILGYEEALGYGIGALVRDKDGISAAVVVADLAARLTADGSTLLARLDALAERYGRHRTLQWSPRVDGPDPQKRMAAWMDRVRHTPPNEIAGLHVTSVRDLASDDPPADVLVLVCGDAARITLRPSGTEPKAKVYIETVSRTGQLSLDPADLQQSLAELIGQP